MLEIFDCEQGGETWYRLRAGIPTASEFATVLAKGKDGGASVTRRKYLYRLAGEIITSEPEATYTNADMERGHIMEEEARSMYSFLRDVTPQRVGFVKRGNYGCSPDSFIGEDGILEIKTAKPSVLIEYALSERFPAEHVAQCQGNLLVTGRQWIDLCIYWPRMEPVIRRAYRDEDYLARLRLALDDFNNELVVIVARLRSVAA